MAKRFRIRYQGQLVGVYPATDRRSGVDRRVSVDKSIFGASCESEEDAYKLLLADESALDFALGKGSKKPKIMYLNFEEIQP